MHARALRRFDLPSRLGGLPPTTVSISYSTRNYGYVFQQPDSVTTHQFQRTRRQVYVGSPEHAPSPSSRHSSRSISDTNGIIHRYCGWTRLGGLSRGRRHADANGGDLRAEASSSRSRDGVRTFCVDRGACFFFFYVKGEMRSQRARIYYMGGAEENLACENARREKSNAVLLGIQRTKLRAFADEPIETQTSCKPHDFFRGLRSELRKRKKARIGKKIGISWRACIQ